MAGKPKTIDEYLDSLTGEKRNALAQLRMRKLLRTRIAEVRETGH